MHFYFNSLNLPFTALITVFGIFSLIFCIGEYLCSAIGLYKISKNTGISNPWLAFIPIGNNFLVGKLADRYNANQNKKTHYAIITLILSVIPTLISFFSPFVMIASRYIGYNPLFSSIVFALLPLSFVIFLSSTGFKVINVLSYYFLYQDFEPSRVAVYTILTAFNLQFIPLILIRNNVPVGMAGEQYPHQPKFK